MKLVQELMKKEKLVALLLVGLLLLIVALPVKEKEKKLRKRTALRERGHRRRGGIVAK